MKERKRNRNIFNQRDEDMEHYGRYSGHIYRGQEQESQGIYNAGGQGQYNTGNRGYDNRVNYFPDNDDNRNYRDRDYDNSQYGTSGTAGYLGNRNYEQGYNNQGNYDNDYNDPYIKRGRGNMGYKSNFEKRYYDQHGQTDEDYNRYGGDTRNYGNANQGGFDRDWWDRTRDEVAAWFGDDDAERRRKMDKHAMGGFKGKGPKNYRRSEQRILEDVCDRLTYDDMLDATDMEVQVMGSEVVLTGFVQTRDQKRRAEYLVETVNGVENVENRLKIGQAETSVNIK
jgi:Predicted periplasmic or secreted lipoprotein